jgi:cytochrome c oxidase cbb3-type subunit 3/ubiquinol-cytochrome c reductase cytochrome c subunit
MMRRQIFATVLVLVVSIGIGALGRNREVEPLQRRGGRLYQRMCAVCHGANGAGYKADQAPALTHPDFLATASNAFLRSAIVNGRPGTTMSAWSIERGSPLVATDVDAVIAFLRGWDRSPHPALDGRPVRGDVPRGSEIFARECARCHGALGTGGPYVNIGSPQLLAQASDAFLRYAIRNGRPGTAMPAFGATLGDQGIDDVLTLLRSWEAAAHAPKPPPALPAPIPLGPVPIHPRGPEPIGFHAHPLRTSMEVVRPQLERRARLALLDARTPSDYVLEHIAGAVSVPFYDVETYAAALPRNAWLICYCSCPLAESGQLAQALLNKGFTKVSVLEEGLRGWKAKGYPTHAGTSP